VKGKLKHVIDAMEVYKQFVEQLVIGIEKEKQSIQQSVIQMKRRSNGYCARKIKIGSY
jgi:hypothetical protein